MILEITRKKSIAAIIILVVLIAIPVTVYLSSQQQETHSHAAELTTTTTTTVPEDAVVATINGESITKAQVRTVAEEQYASEDVDSAALKVALATLEERKILDKAVTTFQITVDSNKVNQMVESEGISETDAKYEVLQDQVTLKAVDSVQALSIDFWNPPAASLTSLTATEKTTANKELADGKLALNQAQTRMTAGEDVLAIAESLIAKYPSLVPVLSINGQVVDTLQDSDNALAKQPAIYESGDSGLDKTTQDQLFALSAGGIKKIIDTESNRGGSVFKVISKGNANGVKTYDAWYAAQKAAQVTEVGNL